MSSLEKVVKQWLQAMIPIEDIFMLSIDLKLDYALMKSICLTGHSRVPAYEEVKIPADTSDRMLKSLLDPKDAVPLHRFLLNNVSFVQNNESLLSILGRIKMVIQLAIVSRSSVEKAASVKKERMLPNERRTSTIAREMSLFQCTPVSHRNSNAIQIPAHQVDQTVTFPVVLQIQQPPHNSANPLNLAVERYIPETTRDIRMHSPSRTSLAFPSRTPPTLASTLSTPSNSFPSTHLHRSNLPL
ncbi:hypothetical protein EDD22DRAFT_1022526 [Suillus occidentalis]|nr:hypothetical protein EDD22DRAFT_1022526 [Suillus occidentalis]